MICQWVGGPNDGGVMEVPSGWQSVKVPVVDDRMWLSDGERPDARMTVLTVPIEQVRVDAIDALGVRPGVMVEGRLMWNAAY